MKTKCTRMLLKTIPMNTKPSSWRVSGYQTMSVKHQRWYVRARIVQSFMTSIKLAFIVSNGMYQSVTMTEARDRAFSRATWTQRIEFATISTVTKRSLFEKKMTGTRIKYHFDLL